MELVSFKPYNYTLTTLLLLHCALIDGIMLTLRTVNKPPHTSTLLILVERLDQFA